MGAAEFRSPHTLIAQSVGNQVNQHENDRRNAQEPRKHIFSHFDLA
jgi:hypothetical protein